MKNARGPPGLGFCADAVDGRPRGADEQRVILVAPLLAAALLAPPGPAASPAVSGPVFDGPFAQIEVAEPPRAAPRILLPRELLRAALEAALVERGRLRRFQLGTSKFLDGRAVLHRLELLPSTEPGVARFELHGGLDYARRQLGVKWRGLKSHKKWFDKGRKEVARVRVTGEVRLERGADTPSIRASALRVKIVSRLTPARGLTARWDMGDRSFPVPDGLGALLLDRIEIERSTREAIVLAPRGRP